MSSSHADLDRLKLKYVTWYCDKEPHGFVAFMSNCAAITRSLGFGMEVDELYLDVKLSRTTYQAMLVSSVISADPDFTPPEPDSQGEEVTSGDTTHYQATWSESQQSDTTHRTMRCMASLKGALVKPIIQVLDHSMISLMEHATWTECCSAYFALW